MQIYFAQSLKTFFSVIVGLLLTISCACTQDLFTTISVKEAKKRMESDTTMLVLDVRTKEEFTGETGHLKKAKLIPVQELEGRLSELAEYKPRTILVYCRSGKRSAQASELLAKRGFTPINVAGGIIAWNEAQYPVEK